MLQDGQFFSSLVEGFFNLTFSFPHGSGSGGRATCVVSYWSPVQIPSIVELYYTAITLKKHQNFGSFEEVEDVKILSSESPSKAL